MNVLRPETETEQTLIITPRDGTSDMYLLTIQEEGKTTTTEQLLPGTKSGSFLQFSLILNLTKAKFYWFKVYTTNEAEEPVSEIYRGKLLAATITDEPLHYNMYQ